MKFIINSYCLWDIEFYHKESTYWSLAKALSTAKSLRWLGDIHRYFSARAKVLPPKPNMAENPKRRSLPEELKLQTSTDCMWPWEVYSVHQGVVGTAGSRENAHLLKDLRQVPYVIATYPCSPSSISSITTVSSTSYVSRWWAKKLKVVNLVYFP